MYLILLILQILQYNFIVICGDRSTNIGNAKNLDIVNKIIGL